LPSNLAPYLFALSAGFVYTISALLAKRGLELGAGTFRSLVYSNWVMALFFIPYPMLAEVPLVVEDLKVGGMIGILFFAAQSCCFIALRSGDASMVTPIMGSKSVFVALFLFILNLSPTPLGPATWTAAILAAIAVALIGWPARGAKPSLMGLGFALATAAGFGLVDALVPHFSHLSDPFNVLFSMFATVGLLSFLLIPLSRGKFLAFRGRADRWMWASCFPMGAQAVLMSIAIGFHHVPTEANVFYSCRGFWAILLVAWFGKRIGLEEGTIPKATQIRRLLGACLLLAGIYLAPLGGS
jgi:drug/metabolite transporter (DMT)-like permease